MPLTKDELFEQMLLRYRRKKMLRYTPYEKQRQFHAAGAHYRERALFAGNQLGKCTRFQTLIEHPDGTSTEVGRLYENGEPFMVWAWDGGSLVPAMAVSPIRKDREECLRLYLSDGSSLECSLGHSVLTAASWQRGERLLEFFASLPASSSERARLIRDADVLHLTGMPQDYLRGCPEGHRLCDGQPLWGLSTDQEPPPSQGGVPQHSQISSHVGDLARRFASTLPVGSVLPANWDAVLHLLARFFESLAPGPSLAAQLPTGYSPTFEPLGLESGFQPQSTGATDLHQSEFSSASTPPVAGKRIVWAEPIGVNDVYDFTVPGYGNYVTGGIIHHNTFCAAFEVAMHLTGIYPEWWEGRVYRRPILVWTGSKTYQTSKEIIQMALYGTETADMKDESFGTGAIPGDKILDVSRRQSGVKDVIESAFIQHVTGGRSRVVHKTYEEGRATWQGKKVDVIWNDEESDDGTYTEALARTTDVPDGMMMNTFTPLQGMTNVVKRYLQPEDPDNAPFYVYMTIDDVDHYSEERKREIIAQYPAHEREARTRGVPIMGEGRVFMTPEEYLKCHPIKIQPFHRQICGIDFGSSGMGGHPFGYAKLVYDADSDIVYLADCYSQKGHTTDQHASAIKKRGKWIPVSWPHDGMNAERGTGVPLWRAFLNEGVNMLSMSARYSNDKGGRQDVEPIVDDLEQRMATGRFKVFSHLTPFFDEYRSYHRKDGKIVAIDDDVLKSVMYALMMLRYAMTESESQRGALTYAPQHAIAGNF